jgi:hypothetical protein
MSDVRDEFIKGIAAHLRPKGFPVGGKKTANGVNLFTLLRNAIEVTANIAPNDDRVSVKLTINRGVSDGPTPAFNALRAKYERENGLDGKVEWKRDSGKKESRVQVRTSLSKHSDVRTHFPWVEKNAVILRDWAKEAEKFM